MDHGPADKEEIGILKPIDKTEEWHMEIAEKLSYIHTTIAEKLSYIHADIGILARYLADINQSLAGLKAIGDMVAQNPLFSRFNSADTPG